tara:strand:- start:163 stop:276 length:114 start_codon:yes stop_codon:yes gene_type:complete
MHPEFLTIRIHQQKVAVIKMDIATRSTESMAELQISA